MVCSSFTVCPIVGSHSCPVHLDCLSSGSGHVLNPEQHRPALLTMVAVSKLAIFKNVRESVALGLDFYLNKNNFKQGAFKGRISAGTRPLRTFNVLLASLLLSR